MIGGKGPEIQFVSIATGAVTKRLTLPDLPRIVGQGNDPFGWEPQPGGRSIYVDGETAPRLVPSPDGSWLAAVLAPGTILTSLPPQFEVGVAIFDVASGAVRGRLTLPTAGNTYQTAGFLPLLAFGGGGRWLSALTPQQVTVASVPDGTPLHAADLPATRVALPSDPQVPREHRGRPASAGPGRRPRWHSVCLRGR